VFSLGLPVFLRIFANMNNDTLGARKWSRNVILADADYIDNVAFNLIVNFERMLGRRIPAAGMARWIDCVALDGGLRGGGNETQVVLIHDGGSPALANFTPAHYERELDGKAFSDTIGEFLISAVAVESIVTKEQLFCESLALLCSQEEVRRIMVVPDAEMYYDAVRRTLRQTDVCGKDITVLGMQPLPGGNFKQEILGYSIMSALGIEAEEIEHTK